MNIFVMRHGTTVWNEKGITQGRTNNRLSQDGKKLVEDVAKQYKDEKFDVIVCSPLTRTVQTANIMNKYHKTKTIRDDCLLEIDQGIFTGRKWKSLTDEEKKLKKERAKQTGMESYDEAFERAEQFIKRIKTNYDKYNSILVVTHNIIASFIEDIIQNKTKDFEDASFVKSFSNAQVKHFVI